MGDEAERAKGTDARDCHQSSAQGAFAGDAEQFFVQSSGSCAEWLVDHNESICESGRHKIRCARNCQPFLETLAGERFLPARKWATA